MRKVIDFWFGDEETLYERLNECGRLWFQKNPDTDRYIVDNFSEQVHTALQEPLSIGDKSTRDPLEVLAQILLLDQMTRNIFRGTAEAFSGDSKAKQLSSELLGVEECLHPVQRCFIYLPFEHSEDLKDQKLSVQLFTKLRDDSPKAYRVHFESYLDYAIQHQRIIERFGRFPHRNTLLNRSSTEEEISFLQQPNSSF